MLFTIPRRGYSTLPQITVEIDAKYESASNAMRLGAAVRVVIGQARKNKTRANLTRADLTGANLTRADIPVVQNIDAAIYAAITDGKGQLKMSAWHTCMTTHCRAGWAVTLAGEAGAALENRYGPAAAAALIYAKSRPGVPVPNFYASNKNALADIKACAGVAS